MRYGQIGGVHVEIAIPAGEGGAQFSQEAFRDLELRVGAGRTYRGRVISLESYYDHSEGNSDSHVKTALVGNSVTVLIEDGRLVLGTWQGIHFCEFDGPRERRVLVKVVGF